MPTIVEDEMVEAVDAGRPDEAATLNYFQSNTNELDTAKHDPMQIDESFTDDLTPNISLNNSPANGTSNSSDNHMSAEKVSRTNLYIKGLPEDFDDEKLWNLPPVQNQIKSVKAATDDEGKCRGYGFIDFVCEESANEAIRYIREAYPSFTIKFAKENEKDKTNLYVTNLPRSWTTKDSDRLKLVFERFGQIQSAFVMMERTTNRTTGVGFVRFANERDALRTLELLKTEPIVFPECSAPVEAKFADKHNPDTRRRRHPATSLLAAQGLNGLIGYPLALNGVSSHDALSALIQGSLPLQASTGGPVALHSLQSKTDYNRRLAQGLLSTTLASKYSTTTAAIGGMPDLNGMVSTESPLNAFAAAAVAASALLAGSTPGFVNGCLRPNAHPASLNGGLLSTAGSLNLMAPNSNETSLLDSSGLYGCSFYGPEFYRNPAVAAAAHQHQHHQHQQQQQLTAAAALAAAMNGHSSTASIYPDLASYLSYQGLLGSPQTHPLNSAVSPNCLVSNAANLGAIYATQTMINSNGQINEPLAVNWSNPSNPQLLR